MGYKQDYNQGSDIRLGSAIAIINSVLKQEYEELKNSNPTREEVLKKARNSWTLELLIGEYLGEHMTMGMDSWKVFWCGVWLNIYKTKVIDDGLNSLSTITGIQIHKNLKEQYENKMLSDVIREYKEINKTK